MAFDLKAATPDASFPTTGFLFGADSQSVADPSIFTAQAVSTTLLELGNIFHDGGNVGIGTNSPTAKLDIAGGTVTTASSVLNLTQTWNAGAVTFTGLKLNITDTSSAATSLLASFQVGGSSKFSVSKIGAIVNASTITAAGAIITTHAFGVQVQNNTGFFALGTNADALIGRNAAHSIRFGATDAAAPAAQTLGVQSVVAGTSNTAGTLWTLKLSASTGSAVGGDLDITGTPAGGAGSAQNSYVSFLRLRALDKSALFGSYQEMAEMTAPSAPAANSVRIFAQDNGAGKTQLMAIFGSGAAQQITIEP